MHSIPPELRGRPFTVAEAIRRGLTRRSLQSSQFAMVRQGVYRTADTEPTFLLEVQGALLVLPDGAVASHTTALRLQHLDVAAPLPLHFSAVLESEVNRDGIVFHRRQAELNPIEVDGIRTLGPRRTFVDVATMVSSQRLLAVGDWLVATQRVKLPDLRSYVVESHLDGVRHARRIAPLVREDVASVYESYVRWELHAAGLPEPEINVDIYDDHGAWLAKGDLVYRRQKVVVEYDGWQHERDAAQRQWDHLRREQLEAAGWRVIVITVEDMKHPKTIAARVRQALR